jgi:SRSO17 transposase
MIWPIAGRGRPRKRYIPNILSMAAEDMLANAKWRAISWRTGTKGKLKARFAAVRVRVADGPPQRIRDKGQQHLPGDEAWLIGEHRISGEKKYYLANLPAKMDLRTLASVIKARWICEQAHQQLKIGHAAADLLDHQASNAADIVALRIARLPDRDEHGGGDDTERQPAG